ncbi:unnamed protein product [Pedinophyceae sp. YPF-701]|nr:unnamed protein product [Pedinophyceae sp. YPF-701]
MEGTEEGRRLAAAARKRAKELGNETLKAPAEPLRHTDSGARTDASPDGPPCTHEVAIPQGWTTPPDDDPSSLDPAVHGTLENPIWTGPMAKEYPFKLDPFQSTSIACVERRESVMVAAHTSAGKTVVAEYAVAKALKEGQRVVYTSPLKALSNQKFRELQEEFDDVGLMTGDVTLSPSAGCVVMTTEILRSMLYRGSELLREVAWVVFDEVHYMQDRERGVVWEETIIFMPKHTRTVFLSATLSNSREFVQWVAHLHSRPVHVVMTEHRPTPLQHYAFPCGGSGLYLVKDEHGTFKTEMFAKMRRTFEEKAQGKGDGALKRKGDGSQPDGDKNRAGGRPAGGLSRQVKATISQDLSRLLSLIKERALEPVIVFSFSRRECEQYAMSLAKVDFNSEEERAAVDAVFDSAMQCLSEEDRKLPAIGHLLPLLRRGVGIHHSGLLPVLKELVEVLFQEHLIKALFATETFAMGVNMPASTVIFTSLRKWDGEEHRWVSSGEYVQMSGRAGRRGMDERGVCILMADPDMDEATCRELLVGRPNPLVSSFRLSYYTLLNLMRRTEGSTLSMEHVIKNSFQQFQHERGLLDQERRLSLLAEEIDREMKAAGLRGDGAATDSAAAARRCVELEAQLADARRQLAGELTQPGRVLPFLRHGRLVRMRQADVDWGWGVVLAALRRTELKKKGDAGGDAGGAVIEVDDTGGAGGSKEGDGGEGKRKRKKAKTKEAAGDAGTDKHQAALGRASDYVIDVLLLGVRDAQAGPARFRPPREGEEGDIEAMTVSLALVEAVSRLRIALPPDLRQRAAKESVKATLASLLAQRGGPEGLPVVSLCTDVLKGNAAQHLVDLEARAASLAKEASEARQGVPAADAERVGAALKRSAALAAERDLLKQRMQESTLAVFRSEAKARGRVLRRLGHIDGEGVVQLKGRAACEIDTADELLAAELMFNGAFANSLDKHQLAALASCLVPVEKSQEEIQLSRELAPSLKQLQDTARMIAEVSRECKLDLDVEEYVESFKPYLMDVVYAWSRGSSFADVCKMTDIFEGSIIRAVRRLDELLKQLKLAAAAVGDEGLAGRFQEASESIHRDIMFAASLYV